MCRWSVWSKANRARVRWSDVELVAFEFQRSCRCTPSIVGGDGRTVSMNLVRTQLEALPTFFLSAMRAYGFELAFFLFFFFDFSMGSSYYYLLGPSLLRCSISLRTGGSSFSFFSAHDRTLHVR